MMRKQPRFACLFRCVFLLPVIWLQACSSPAILPAEELNRYIGKPSHGLSKEVEANGTLFSVRYHPRDFLVMQEFNTLSKKDSQALATMQQKYQPYDYFMLDISRNGKEAIRQLGSQAKYSEMLQVLAFNMREYVNITTADRDTVEMADYAFQQSYGMSNANNLLFVFPAEKLKKADKYTLNIRECGFQTGDLRFEFRRKDISAVPALSFPK